MLPKSGFSLAKILNLADLDPNPALYIETASTDDESNLAKSERLIT